MSPLSNPNDLQNESSTGAGKTSKTSNKKGTSAQKKNAIVNAIEEQQIDELEATDDWGSAWKECKELGQKWGGRGFGGRATGRTTVQTRDVVVEGCTMAYLGTNLLERTTLRLLHKHRYGLIGRNGVGKSTLMRRIYSGTLPGFPPHLRVAQVMQELPMADPDSDITPVQYCIDNDPQRRAILQKIDEIEGSGMTPVASPATTGNNSSGSASGSGSGLSIEAEAELLQELYDMLEDEGVVTQRAVRVLKELGFTAKRRDTPMHSLSGGWRMRTSIACALTQEPDILLLDEPTNHLDLEGVEWLKTYLLGPMAEDLTILVTSHDKNFLDAICTDIIRFHNQELRYYPGNFTDYELARHDKELNMQRTQEGIDRQRKHMEDTIKKMQIQASKDSSGKGQGQVASRKKKLARHGAEKNANGHRFKAQQDSWKGISSGIRSGSQNEVSLGAKTGMSRSLIEAAEKEWKMVLPDPIPLSSMESCSCLQLRDASIGYPLNKNGGSAADSSSECPVTPQEPTRKGLTTATATATAAVKTVKRASLGTQSALAARNAAAMAAAAADPSLDPANYHTVLEHITLDANQHSKIGIVGKNGCGKSTLMKVIYQQGLDHSATAAAAAAAGGGLVGNTNGENDTDTTTAGFPVLLAGDITKHHALRVAYFQQHQQDCLPYEQSPLEYLTSISPPGMQSEQLIRAHLGSFGLSGPLALQQIGKLSGGQKARVVLAELTAHKPHLLLLDEPSNNLDMDSVRALQEAVKAFNGAVIVASHDMSLVEDICVEVYHMVKGRLSRLDNGVSEYQQYVASTVARQRSSNT